MIRPLSEIEDWARNNMNWSDVGKHAVQLKPRPEAIDWEDGWANGKAEVVT